MLFASRMRMARFMPLILLMLCGVLLQGCVDDLAPSDKDERSFEAATTESFTMTDTDGQTLHLETLLEENDAVVLYFTMWCPLCDSHMSHLSTNYIGEYPNVAFIMVDYVSSTVDQSRRSKIENGYQSSLVVADVSQDVLNRFGATMASTVVINVEGQVVLNEDYKNGARLKVALDSLN